MTDTNVVQDPLQLAPEDMQWWRDAKFGMFIHWGVYALLGRGEWAMFMERIDVDEYAKLADRFDAREYRPAEWAAAAKAAGMKYMVLTTKHHDGYSLWDTQATDFNSVKTAARRDLVAEYVQAVRDAGLKVGFYYSPLDWRFPGFFFPQMYHRNALAMKEQTYTQVRELMTNYGPIDILWYDGGSDGWLGLGGLEFGGEQPYWHVRWPKPYKGPAFWEERKLNAMVRELQPKIVINDRSGWAGDFDTREHEDGEFQSDRPWERCATLAGAWGWQANAKMRSREDVIQFLVRMVGRDGNLLLNVGPMANGMIEPRQVARLAEVGEWLRQYGESIYGTRGGPYMPDKWGVATHKGSRIYLHVLDWPEGGPLMLPALSQEVVSATGLTCDSVRVDQRDGWLVVDVPASDRKAVDTIIALDVA